MSDTGDSILPSGERKLLDRIAKAARGGEDNQIIVVNRGADTGSFSKLKDALLLASILGLVATVWNMSINMAEMRATMNAVVAELKELKDDLKARAKP